ANAGKPVLTGLAANLENVVARRIGPQNRVIDQRSDGRIDTGGFVAGRYAVSSGRYNLLSLCRTGLGAALLAAGADQIRNVESFGFREARPADPAQDLFTHLRAELI